MSSRRGFCFRTPGERRSCRVPMTYSFDDDRWYATLPPRPGRRMVVHGRGMGGPVRHLARRAGEEGGRGAGRRLRAARRAPSWCARPSPTRAATTTRRLAGLRPVARRPGGRSRGAGRRRALAGAAGAHGHLRPARRPHPRRPGVPGAGGPGATPPSRRGTSSSPARPPTIPRRHGTFADAERALPRIAALGFDVVYLPPIHPIGRTHRKGPNNSARRRARTIPAAPGPSATRTAAIRAVNPDLGTLDDFRRFVRRRARARPGGRARLRAPVLARSSLGPGASRSGSSSGPTAPSSTPRTRPRSTRTSTRSTSGATSARRSGTPAATSSCSGSSSGVRTFRVDNPHTKPFAFWEWVIAEVQQRHPDVVFLAEAFTRPKRMQDAGASSGSPSPTPTSPGATARPSWPSTSPSSRRRR